MKIKIKKKFIILIPFSVSVFYTFNNILTFVGLKYIKSIKLKTKIFFSKNKRYIYLTNIPISKVSSKIKKFFKIFRKTLLSLIKKLISEIIYISKKKLKLIGIGFKVFKLKLKKKSLLYFKLGYSHNIYIYIPKSIFVFCYNQTKILIYGNSQQKINNFSFLIQSFKIPEIYKGKGIMYENKKLILKLGKKKI